MLIEKVSSIDKNVEIENKNKIQEIILTNYSNTIKNNLLTIYSKLKDDTLYNSNIQKVLNVKGTGATKYIKILIK